eukprot:7087593-Alexandrium_andersonii.AAC.1
MASRLPLSTHASMPGITTSVMQSASTQALGAAHLYTDMLASARGLTPGFSIANGERIVTTPFHFCSFCATYPEVVVETRTQTPCRAQSVVEGH